MEKPCPICGNEDLFVQYRGIFVCELCGITEDVKEVREMNDNCLFGNSRIKKLAEEGVYLRKKNGSWSSAEGFNTILFKWCEALKNLGVPSIINDGVFTVWFKYLEDCNIFSDNAISRKIKYKRDINYFGGKKEKKTRVHHTNLDTVHRKAHCKGKLNASYVSKHVFHEMSVNETFTDITQQADEDEESINTDNNEADSNPIHEEDKFIYTYTNGCGLDRRAFFLDMTIEKVLAIFYLGIRMVHADVFASDIIRWCRQSYILYFGAWTLLEDDKKHFIHDMNMFQKPLYCSDTLMTFAGLFAIFLSLPIVPLVDYSQVWKRFTDQLRLPEEINELCQLLLDLTVPSHYLGLTIPNIELDAAIYIILALKICFCIDDNHETILSDWADKINRIKLNTKGEKQFFSFTNWQRFIDKSFWWLGQVSPFNDMNEKCQDSDTQKLKSHFDEIGSKYYMLKGTDWASNLCETINKFKFKESNSNQDKILFSPYNSTTGLFKQYINISKEKSVPEHLLQAAEELEVISFKDQVFNWVTRTEEIERTLSKKVKHEVVYASLAFNELHKKKESHNKFLQKKVQVILPDPKLSYWKMKEAHVLYEKKDLRLPINFNWLITLFSRLCETSENKVLKRFRYIEGLYYNRAKI